MAGREPRAEFECPECGQAFFTTQGLKVHSDYFHNRPEPTHYGSVRREPMERNAALEKITHRRAIKGTINPNKHG